MNNYQKSLVTQFIRTLMGTSDHDQESMEDRADLVVKLRSFRDGTISKPNTLGNALRDYANRPEFS